MVRRSLVVLTAFALPWAFVTAQSGVGTPSSSPCDSNCHARMYHYSRYSNRCGIWNLEDCTLCGGGSGSTSYLCTQNSSDPPNCVTTNPGIPNTIHWYAPTACNQTCAGWTSALLTQADPFFIPDDEILSVDTTRRVCSN